ncbi:MAG TPA: hypothetical protein VF793_15585, partial [Telluria sp.]
MLAAFVFAASRRKNGRVEDFLQVSCENQGSPRAMPAAPATNGPQAPMTQVFNFSAGPAVLPKEVLQQAAAEM